MTNYNRRSLLLALVLIAVFLLGMIAGIAATLTVQAALNTTEVNCNNLSANDGPNYEERDITAAEFDKHCK